MKVLWCAKTGFIHFNPFFFKATQNIIMCILMEEMLLEYVNRNCRKRKNMMIKRKNMVSSNIHAFPCY